MKVYLDTCCFSRLTDDQSQARIRDEAEAMERILAEVSRGPLEMVASEALEDELNRIPKQERRIETTTILGLASVKAYVDDEVASRATELHELGYAVYDALHLAAAESVSSDVLLTTDDRFLKRARRGVGAPRILVENPLSWSKKAGM